MNFVDYALLMAAAFLAGGVNAIAGGGTLISFPALVWLGRPPIIANAPNTIAVWPASLSAGFRHCPQVRTVRPWVVVPSPSPPAPRPRPRLPAAPAQSKNSSPE